jgi:hypothetical protein
MRQSDWQWKERLSAVVAVLMFFVFLGPLFGVTYPMGSHNLTLRLICAVIWSAISGLGCGFFLYLFLKA